MCALPIFSEFANGCPDMPAAVWLARKNFLLAM